MFLEKLVIFFFFFFSEVFAKETPPRLRNGRIGVYIDEFVKNS